MLHGAFCHQVGIQCFDDRLPLARGLLKDVGFKIQFVQDHLQLLQGLAVVAVDDEDFLILIACNDATAIDLDLLGKAFPEVFGSSRIPLNEQGAGAGPPL